MNHSKLKQNSKQKKKQRKKQKHWGLISWFKEDIGLKLSCVGIAIFFILILAFSYFNDKMIEARRVSVDAYSLEEMNQILSTANEIQYACYSDYWNVPFTILVNGKGLGTLTIPIFDSVNITNKAEKVLCMQEKIKAEFEEARGLTYALKNQGETTGYLVENSHNGYLFDAEKKLVAIYNEPEWEEDKNGMNLTDSEGNIIARLNCDLSLLTMTISYFTDDFRLTPEQQMSMINFYNSDRYSKYPEEFTPLADDDLL